jgi:hypothetical protein
VQGTAGEDDPGVVVGEVEPAEALERRGDEAPRLHRIGDVGREERSPAGARGERHRLLAPGRVDVDDEDIGAGGDQRRHRGSADPRGGPGDDPGAAGERGGVEGPRHQRRAAESDSAI